MSWAFISALKQNPQQSYVQLLNSIRDVLETKYTQKPQLSCSHPLGAYLFPFEFHFRECNFGPADRRHFHCWQIPICFLSCEMVSRIGARGLGRGVEIDPACRSFGSWSLPGPADR